MEVIGWISSFLLAACGVPQALKSWRTKSSAGISLAFLLMWFAGELTLLVYSSGLRSLPMMVNASVNLVLVSVVLWYLHPKGLSPPAS